jgi:hypothetical protein
VKIFARWAGSSGSFMHPRDGAVVESCRASPIEQRSLAEASPVDRENPRLLPQRVAVVPVIALSDCSQETDGGVRRARCQSE